MRIGVDARLLSLPLTGIGRYTAELSRALLKQAEIQSDNFFLYMPSSPIGEDWSHPCAQVRSRRLRGRLARMLWSQTVLPWEATRDGVEIFWGTTHRLPRYLPAHIARVVTVHDLVWKHAGETMRPLSRWMEQRLMPEAIRLADRVLADSQSTADDVMAAFPNQREKIRVVHLGITPLVIPQPRESLRLLGIDKPYFLFVGTLEPRKNLGRLLVAFARLPEAVRTLHMLVIVGGKGWGGVDLHELIKSHGLLGNVVGVGYVRDAQLSTLYAHARFLAMPSIYEGFGLPLVEAMSLGVPVLTSNRSSLPEVAGDAGLLVDPFDVSALATGLLSMLADDVLCATLAGRARTNAARFSWAKASEQTRAVFSEAITERRDNSRSARF
jgi:glycosyltransferase involved in cell wall biosynthesis